MPHLRLCLMLVLFQSACVLSEHAMTTVLARPLGGYGLTPLIFEPSTIMLGQSSNSIETKVRKSPVFEVLMPNYDDEPMASLPMPQPVTTRPQKPSTKKIDYESLISKNEPDKTISAPSTNSYYSSNNMIFDEQIPSYKEQISRSDYHKSSHLSSTSSGYQPYSNPGPVSAAVQSIRSVEVKNVQNSYENNEPQIIDIPPSALPIVINFRTSSSQIQIHQTHENSEPAEVQQTQSQDEPQYLKHQVTKPVIQEVHEIILPYRKITQEIRPVEEEIHTIVARGKGRRGDNYERGGKGSSKGGYGGGGGGGKKQSIEQSDSYKSKA